MTEPISLHSFCKEHGNLPKTSVRRWLNDNGYSTSNGLSLAAVEAAIAQFCPTAVEAAPATSCSGSQTARLMLANKAILGSD